ncbi:MAG: transposase [Bacilli bacterium]
MAKDTIKDIWNAKQKYYYVYKQQCYWDVEKKQARYKRKLIGKRLTKNGDIIYNNRSKLEMKLEEESKATSLKEPHKSISETPAPIKVTSLGAEILLEKYIESNSLRKFLSKTLQSKEDAEEVLSIAKYNICTNQAFSWSGQWIENHSKKLSYSITSQGVSELLKRITQSKIEEFLKKWVNSNINSRGYYCFDSTNIKSSCKNDSQVQYGYTHGHEPYPQKNLSILSSQKNNIPVWYSLYDGSLNDSKTIKNLSERLHNLTTRNICFVLDRGYYSKENIQNIVNQGDKFLIPLPNSVKWQFDIIDQKKIKLLTTAGTIKVVDSKGTVKDLQCATKTMVVDHHRYWVHVYYDSLKRSINEKKFFSMLNKLRAELESGKEVAEHKDLYDKFFFHKTTPKRGKQIKDNAEAQLEFNKSYSGFWCLYTDSEKDGAKAYEAYAGRNTAEIFFDDYKNSIDGYTSRSHTLEANRGREFILFIELIILNLFKNDLRNKQYKLKNCKIKNYHEILNRMESLIELEYPSTNQKVYMETNTCQKIILKALGLKWNGSQNSET